MVTGAKKKKKRDAKQKRQKKRRKRKERSKRNEQGGGRKSGRKKRKGKGIITSGLVGNTRALCEFWWFGVQFPLAAVGFFLHPKNNSNIPHAKLMQNQRKLTQKFKQKFNVSCRKILE